MARTVLGKRGVVPGEAQRRPGTHAGTVQEWVPDRRGCRRLSGTTVPLIETKTAASI